jgi:hypothetical protein
MIFRQKPTLNFGDSKDKNAIILWLSQTLARDRF